MKKQIKINEVKKEWDNYKTVKKLSANWSDFCEYLINNYSNCFKLDTIDVDIRSNKGVYHSALQLTR